MPKGVYVRKTKRAELPLPSGERGEGKPQPWGKEVPKMDQTYLTAKQVARRLHCSPSSITRMVAQGRIKGVVRIGPKGRAILIPLAEVGQIKFNMPTSKREAIRRGRNRFERFHGSAPSPKPELDQLKQIKLIERGDPKLLKALDELTVTVKNLHGWFNRHWADDKEG